MKIVYLLGTGATNAEKHLECKIKNTGIDEDGKLQAELSSNGVSGRVIDKLVEGDLLDNYGINSDNIHTPWSKKDFDIEFLISILESLKTELGERHSRTLRQYYRNDIIDNIHVTGETITPRLLTSLIEWHNLDGCNEELIGFITLNYDSILETAFTMKHEKFNYGIEDIQVDASLDFEHEKGNPYLLKLHGSFDWFRDTDVTNKLLVKSTGPSESMQWIPPQLFKKHNKPPFNILYKKAQDILNECDILRVIGCSLSANDFNLISLLFKTQMKRGRRNYKIEPIASRKRVKDLIKDRLGFLSFEESFYEKDDWGKLEKESTNNPFLDWLYYIVINTTTDISSTDHLKKIEGMFDLWQP
ncbi:hypothetical protein BMS3Abin16_01247 [archaeon BMS3Abin16]|nr:hypothetical protein BMS3Abin16_01247 [archaeon BMS3Abin16]